MDVLSRGHRIHVDVAGAGPALVLVPGILQSTRRWIDMGYVDAFADMYRVVAVDPLGHGQSDRPHDDAEYAESLLVADICAVLDALGIASAHLWGYSGGAMHAVGVALTAPDRVRSLTLGGVPPAIPLEYRPMVFQPWVDALRREDWTEFWRLFLPVDEKTRQILETTNDPRAVAATIAGMMPWDPTLADVRASSLVYMGTKEVFLEQGRQMADEIGAAFHEIPDRGHAGAFQDLATVEPIVRAHLAAVDGSLALPLGRG
jgi:pimeloyl-ACP methyl ester carboxylesterase